MKSVRSTADTQHPLISLVKGSLNQTEVLQQLMEKTFIFHFTQLDNNICFCWQIDPSLLVIVNCGIMCASVEPCHSVLSAALCLTKAYRIVLMSLHHAWRNQNLWHLQLLLWPLHSYNVFNSRLCSLDLTDRWITLISYEAWVFALRQLTIQQGDEVFAHILSAFATLILTSACNGCCVNRQKDIHYTADKLLSSVDLLLQGFGLTDV